MAAAPTGLAWGRRGIPQGCMAVPTMAWARSRIPEGCMAAAPTMAWGRKGIPEGCVAGSRSIARLRKRWQRQVSLYKILFHFKALLWKSIILLLPLPPHLQSLPYCSTIARPLRNTPPPHRTLLCMPCTIQYWRWQYRIKTKRQVARGGAPLIFTILYLLLLYSSWVNPGGLAVSCRSRSLV